MELVVEFIHENIKISVPKNTTIKETILKAGIPFESPCGGKGKCGKCKVKLDIAEPPNSVEKKMLSKTEINSNIRLACQTKVKKDTKVYLLEKTKLPERKAAPITIEKNVVLNPPTKKIFVNTSPPSLSSPLSNEEILKNKLGAVNINPRIFNKLAKIPQETNYNFTSVIQENEITEIEPYDTTKLFYGIALDIGTTTVTASLIDLTCWKTLSFTSKRNPQADFGADVISRINYSLQGESFLQTLQKKILDTINEIVNELSNSANIKKENIYDMTVVGNTTMLHLFLGIPLKTLAFIPYTSVFKTSKYVNASDLKININPEAKIFVFPVVGGFIGGDTIGVILSTELHKKNEINLAIDLGTNGEIILGNKDKILAASTAAGPAFEGVHIKCGMRAIRGAIESVEISNGKILYKTIGEIQPRGICGSGLIDIVAELLKSGFINAAGLMKEEIFQITENIYVTQKDVRELQLAKGAIFAGIEILKQQLGIKNEDIENIYIAGTFGNYINKKNAQIIGLIPEFPEDKIHFVGNAALKGAILGLVSEESRSEAKKISELVEYFELSANSNFMDIFTNSLKFPN